MRLAREGYPFIIGGLVLTGAAWVISWALGPARGGWIGLAVAYALSVLTLFTIWFFRDPAHSPPADPAVVLAPGQGRVIAVSEADEPTYIGGRCRKISIFLTIFDVHVQRSPVSGTVEHRVYRPGRYAMAWRDKASEDNEQASVGIATPHGPVLVRQIAGLVARRIVTDPSEGDSVVRGARIGLIRFGSRVELFLPMDWEVTCKVGDRAVVGRTALARRPVPPTGPAAPTSRGREAAGGEVAP
ncbi:MAG: phosphatidylserine decarboxylase family protein [Gemmatimonadetes bacterium]|nr:phosphatidylserine decarboxylase family protein [Gemmatimonadota bacterium]